MKCRTMETFSAFMCMFSFATDAIPIGPLFHMPSSLHKENKLFPFDCRSLIELFDFRLFIGRLCWMRLAYIVSRWKHEKEIKLNKNTQHHGHLFKGCKS